MPNAYLNVVSAGAFIDATGKALTAGTLVVQPVDGNNNAAPFRSGDDKQVSKAPIQCAITNGSLAQSLQLANPTHPEASPQNMGYTFIVTDQTSGCVTTYTGVLIQDQGGGNWNIGTLATGLYSKAVPIQLVTGPAGKDGAPGPVNFPQLATASGIPALATPLQTNLFDPTRTTSGAWAWVDGSSLQKNTEARFLSSPYVNVAGRASVKANFDMGAAGLIGNANYGPIFLKADLSFLSQSTTPVPAGTALPSTLR